MRRIVWVLLLLFAFSIPWEYSLDLGAPFGNIARMSGLILLLVAAPAALQAGGIRRPGPLHWLTLALYLWFCLISLLDYRAGRDADEAARLFAGDDDRLVDLGVCRKPTRCAQPAARLAGRFVGAGGPYHRKFRDLYPGSAEQIRFAASGQDPNDVARFLDLGFPVAALLLDGKDKWPVKFLADWLFSAWVRMRLADGIARRISGCSRRPCWLRRASSSTKPQRHLWQGRWRLPVAGADTWLIVPRETLDRIASIAEQLQSGDLNQRVNIWSAGWQCISRSATLGPWRRFVCNGCPVGSHRYSAQHSLVDSCRRWAVLARSGNRDSSRFCALHPKNQRRTSNWVNDLDGGVVRFFVDWHRGREPHDLAAAGNRCGKSPPC